MAAGANTLREQIHRFLKSTTVWLTAVVLIFAWATVPALLQRSYQRAVDSTSHDLRNLARVFDEHVARILRNTDGAMLSLRLELERNPEIFDLSRWLKQNHGLIEALPQVGIVGADGILLATSAGPIASRIDVSDREHFRVHIGADTDSLFVSKPVLGRASGKWTIQLTRSFRDRNGKFAGVIVFSLDALYFAKLYESVDLGRNGIVALVGLDGALRARAAVAPQDLSKSVAGSRLFEHLGRAPTGIYETVSVVDGVRRLMAYRRLSNYPLIVLVGAAPADYLADYRQDRTILLGFAAFVSAALILAAFFAHRHEQYRRDAEARALRAESERWLHEATLAANDAIVSWDAAGEVSVWNRGAETIFGRDAATARGQPVSTVFRGAVWRQIAAEEARQLRAGVTGRLLQLQVQRPDGKSVQIEAAINRVGAGKDMVIVLVARDISDRLRAEAERKQLTARIFHAQQMEAIGTLAGGVAHDFNNFIGAMQGFVSLARERIPPDSPAAGDLDRATAAGKGAARVVQQLLNFSRQSPGDVAVLDFTETCAEALELAGVSIPSTIRTVQRLPKEPLPITGDAARLQQAILNLVINAAQALGDRPGRIEIGLEAVDTEQIRPAHDVVVNDGVASRQIGTISVGHYARLVVADSGPGIAPAILERIFEPFFTTKSGANGTGLGLAGVEGAITAHGGAIRVTSAEKQGACFELFLPLHAIDLPHDEPTSEVKRASGRVLSVEDDADIRLVVNAVLTRLGYRVTSADNGKDALSLFAVEPDAWDVVVTDMLMPEMNGDSLARSIKALRPNVPVVACTGRIDKATAAEKGLFDAVVAKPDLVTSLPETLARLMEPVTAGR